MKKGSFQAWFINANVYPSLKEGRTLTCMHDLNDECQFQTSGQFPFIEKVVAKQLYEQILTQQLSHIYLSACKDTTTPGQFSCSSVLPHRSEGLFGGIVFTHGVRMGGQARRGGG